MAIAKAAGGKFAQVALMCDAPQDEAEDQRDERRAPVRLPEAEHATQLSMFDVDDSAERVDSGSESAAVGAAGLGMALAGSSVELAGAKAAEPSSPAAGPARKKLGASQASVNRAVGLAPAFGKVAQAYQIDPLLLHAIAQTESRHNPQAVSPAGAIGLMQVMPATARRFGVTLPHSELRDPRISLEVSSAYLKNLQARFNNNLPLVLAAYNAGEGAVEKYGRRIPPYPETQNYVREVLATYRHLLSASGQVARARAVAP